ncbi:hypothetical protein O1D37_002929 [Vibrio cholerae]|nr:hypothetical protein [Vibrio cholerae]EKF9845631.1 hypothetical protein [Vibrio cholerae]
MFLSFIWFYIFKNSSYFSFVCLVGCFQFLFFLLLFLLVFLFLFCSFGLVDFSLFYFVLFGFYLFGVDFLSWFGWWQVFLFCDFIE